MKKRLLHVVLYLPYGGLEKIVYDFSLALDGKDYQVYVAALQEGGPMKDMLEAAGIPVHVLGKRPCKFDFKLLVRLVRLIRILNIEVIHSHSGCIMYAALTSKLTGVSKIIHTEHGRYWPDRAGKIWEDRIFSRFINKFVCVSSELEEYMGAVVKVPRKKLLTVINGVNTSHYRRYSEEDILKLRAKHNIPPDALVLGTVCRLIPQKNVTFLIEWMKTNYNYLNKKLFLMVVGDGPQYDKLIESARDIPCERYKFLGARKDIADLLNIFDIFTLVSTTEGTSLTILEAMSTQLPVIVSDVGGNKEVVYHGKTGFLFECNNQGAFGKCLNKIIFDPTGTEKMGRRARDYVKDNLSFETMIKKYCELYR
jgi:glycosyltransferase involved in cell wall biosynthesis